jgi:hypothetical protein
MVIRTAQAGSSLPSSEINLSTGHVKSKFHHYTSTSSTPQAQHHSSNVSRNSATPIHQQRQSPGRPRISVSIPSKMSAKEERRDDLKSHDEGETVCDYDTNATVLYELLESSTWDRARARCRSHPEEVRTWIIRKDKSLSVRWKLLPLHAAIIFQSPNFLVSALLDQYPAAASKKDDQGMLPLHLAFRHKQEDEDLLELLLVKFPKAVMIKDRRDRVPLEHGRESKFSAKVMRLYADAITAASRQSKGNVLPPTPSTMLSGSSMTALERAALLKEHRDEIAAMKLKTETQLRKVKSASNEQMNQFEEKARKQIDQLRADYEAQIRDMKDAQERRLASMRQSHQSNISHVEQVACEQKKELMERHAEEANELRNLVNKHVNQDREATFLLEKEVAHLQLALQDRHTESEQTVKRNDALKEENKELRDVLTHVQSQQVTLHAMLARQNEDSQASRLIRDQLVKSLLRQDDGDRNAQEILEVADKIRRKVTTSLIDTQQSKSPKRQSSPRQSSPKNRMTAESRIERDRLELQHENTGMNRLENTRTTFLSKSHDDLDQMSPMNSNTNAQTEEFGEGKILADEISAMTDCSEY